jgi:hypothetical protein
MAPHSSEYRRACTCETEGRKTEREWEAVPLSMEDPNKTTTKNHMPSLYIFPVRAILFLLVLHDDFCHEQQMSSTFDKVSVPSRGEHYVSSVYTTKD